MKRLLFMLICIGCLGSGADCQTYNELRDSAAKVREKRDFATAFRLLTDGMRRTEHPYHNDLYDAAAYASLAGMSDSAFFYLDRLLREGEIDMVQYGAPSDEDFKPLFKDDRWRQLNRRADKARRDRQFRLIAAVAGCVRYADAMNAFFDSAVAALSAPGLTDIQFFRRLQRFNRFPGIDSQHRNGLLALPAKINDSTLSFCAVQLPGNYDPAVPHPLLLVLHGAVFMNTGFPDPIGIAQDGFFYTTGMNQFFSQVGYQDQAIVIYPHANREFNWMYPDDGFDMVPDLVRDVKKYFNIDDNRVYVSGHSNGATGVVSYLLKDPSLFAGFYGFNSNPRVRTGGTFIRNAINRSYFNVATDKDYYFPVSGHDSLMRIATGMGIDWQNHVYRGFPHWFPQFKESYPAFQLMFRDMAERVRNPFQHNLYWECDDVRHGRCDWISIDLLDTGAEKKEWQTRTNFTATHWIDNRDTAKVSDTVVSAFEFPRLSGAVRAHYADNRFDIETSRVKTITIYLSPDMVDLTRPVRVFVNGKEVFDKKVAYDRRFMLDNFRAEADRKAIWVNYIQLTP